MKPVSGSTPKVRRTAFDQPEGAADIVKALTPHPLTHRCAAIGCPLWGSCADHAGARSWYCGYHHGARLADMARITSVMTEHQPLCDALVNLRRISASAEIDPAARARVFDAERKRLAAEGYCKAGRGTEYGWQYRMEALLGQKVNAALCGTAPLLAGGSNVTDL